MENRRTKELIALSQQGDLRARSELTQTNLPLVHSIANRFRDRGIDYEDLVQIGSIGLLKAIEGFNFDYDVRFSTYAVPKIMGEIKQQLRKSSTLQVSRGLKSLAAKVISTKDSLAQALGRTPTIAEIAAELGVGREEVVTALDAVAPVYSLEAPVKDDEEAGASLQDFLGTQVSDEHFLLKHALEKLEQYEQKIIVLRYFAEKSQTEVAAQLGISQSQISRLEARIVRRLREEI